MFDRGVASLECLSKLVGTAAIIAALWVTQVAAASVAIAAGAAGERSALQDPGRRDHQVSQLGARGRDARVWLSASPAEGAGDCASVLSKAPLNDVLTRNDGRDFWRFDARDQGAALLGLTCAKADLDRYFEGAGWQLFGKLVESEPVGPQGIERYYADQIIIYCKKARVLLNLYQRKCTLVATVSLLEGKIVSVSAGGTK